jgi:Na+-translocating ferredoxin:NAD+ oxidoreductase RnfC subunit
LQEAYKSAGIELIRVKASSNYPQDFLRCAPSKVIQRIREAGIVGMGGAGFPTHQGLN